MDRRSAIEDRTTALSLESFFTYRHSTLTLTVVFAARDTDAPLLKALCSGSLRCAIKTSKMKTA